MVRRFVALLIGCMIGWLLVLSPVAGVLQAQTGGQLCVRSFEDRNANGVLDAGEPRIVRGVSAQLLNAEGVIIDTILLDDSPQSANGLMCFLRLAPGQYSISITSADYNPVTSNVFEGTVAPNTIPQVFDYGAQIAVADPAISINAGEISEEEAFIGFLERLFFSALGMIIVVGGMTVLGMFIYFVLRPRRPQARGVSQATGAYPAVPPGTGTYPAVRPGTSGMPAVKSETGMMPPLSNTGGMTPIPNSGAGTGSMTPVNPARPSVNPDEDTGPLQPSQ